MSCGETHTRLTPEEIGFVPANEYNLKEKLKKEIELERYNKRTWNLKKIEEAIKIIESERKDLITNDNWKNIKKMVGINDLI